jgi:hypothetical protein
MIPRDAEVIGHVPPRRPIEISPVRKPEPEPDISPERAYCDFVADYVRRQEQAARARLMWAAVVEFAGGGGA